ncbi:MAG: tyrosine-protein phosphatase [Massilimicrobiota sp.]|nr:tyrosine-protein phosphatase [Massilimicrobiota sp.]
MLYMTREQRQIQLEKMVNTRDLGGYETQGGMYSRAHKYIRAAAPTYATSKDIQTLKDYGVKVVIDLRSDFEKECQPNPFQNEKDIDYYEVNLFDSTKATIVPEEVKTYKDLGGVYIYMLEGMKHKFKELFDIFVKYPYEGIMFHCSAGKDRTGVTAALLLDLIGCHEYDIVKDYSESYENNIDINTSLAQMMDNEEAKQYLRSSPRYMMELLDYLREHYGSAKEYLLEIGLKNEEIEQLIENFTI